MVRILKERGKLNLVKGIIIPEGAGTSLAASGTSPQDYDNIPFLLTNGDYRPAATRNVNRAFVCRIECEPHPRRRPGYLCGSRQSLSCRQVPGHHAYEHVGTNNLAVFDYILDWADKNIPNPIVATSCPSGKGQG